MHAWNGNRELNRTIELTQESPRQTKPKKDQFMNFSRGQFGTKVQVNRACFPKEKHQNSQKWPKFMNFSFWLSQGKAPEFTKMAEIHELFVLALSLVWFARATPDSRSSHL